MASLNPEISELPHDRLVRAIEISHYMLGEGRKNSDANETVRGLVDRVIAAGLPLDRMTSIVWLLHAEDAASVRLWDSRTGVNNFTFKYDPATVGGGFERSPAGWNHRTGKWLELWIPETPDDRFPIIPELREAGLTHYLSMPTTAMGMKNSFSFATRSQEGFSRADIAVLRVAFPGIEACQEILVSHRILNEVTRMYIGDGPHKRVLAGDVHRGEVMRIRSAIVFADMRRFTEITAGMSAEEATSLLNDYYDCIVPHIEGNGGEVLKFMGDGVLAIFAAEADGRRAAQAALTSAQAALAAVADYRDTASTPFEVGIALHFGEIAYGNVGSGARLDYTVIGRDVNKASRIAALCGTLGAPLLVSDEFRARCGSNWVCHGTFKLKGLPGESEAFAPSG